MVLSAHLNEINVRAYEELSVDLMLAKPFDIDELRHAIEVLANEPAVFAGGDGD
jgi:DNA-binding response OmpR family regulator